MQEFEFHRPKTIAEALEAVAAGDGARFLAGGQSLLPVMKLELAQPTDLVSLSDIEALGGIQQQGDELQIGALATHAQVAGSEFVRAAIPALAELASRIGDPQVRNRGTLGGSLAHADPAADYPAAVLGLDATILTDRREIAAEAFFPDLFTTALEPGELIRAVRFPIPDRAAYAKFPSPASRFAIVGVFVARTAAGVRVAVTGAGPTVFRVAAMEEALADNFAPEALEGIRIPAEELNSDLDASAQYRAHLVGVMARAAVAAA